MSRRNKEVKTNQEFHKDTRQTMVLVGKKLYELVPTDLTINSIKQMAPGEVPHVRMLNPIPERTPGEQLLKNKGEEKFHKLCQSVPLNENAGKITSLKKAIRLGADVPAEVQKLLKQKEEAQKKGDQETARKIRQQLRKLNYKRYLQEEK